MSKVVPPGLRSPGIMDAGSRETHARSRRSGVVILGPVIRCGDLPAIIAPSNAARATTHAPNHGARNNPRAKSWRARRGTRADGKYQPLRAAYALVSSNVNRPV